MTAGDLFPLALAVAASPFAIIPAVLLLLSPRGVVAATAYLAGWFAGLVVSTVLVILLADRIPDLSEATWVAWIRIAIGVLLLGLAVHSWLGRRGPAKAPSWLTSVSTASPGQAVMLGIVLTLLNPKILLLSVGAGLTIAAADVAPLPAAATYAVIASSTILIPIAVSAVGGDRVVTLLTRLRDWLVRNNAVLMAVVLAALALLLLAEGISALRS
jgi:threonine/homoserine/homoserine lactone efflux protein